MWQIYRNGKLHRFNSLYFTFIYLKKKTFPCPLELLQGMFKSYRILCLCSSLPFHFCSWSPSFSSIIPFTSILFGERGSLCAKTCLSHPHEYKISFLQCHASPRTKSSWRSSAYLQKNKNWHCNLEHYFVFTRSLNSV